MKIKKLEKETTFKKETITHFLEVDGKQLRMYEYKYFCDEDSPMDDYDYQFDDEDIKMFSDDEVELLEDSMLDLLALDKDEIYVAI